jgi:hypothetical protein
MGAYRTAVDTSLRSWGVISEYMHADDAVVSLLSLVENTSCATNVGSKPNTSRSICASSRICDSLFARFLFRLQLVRLEK